MTSVLILSFSPIAADARVLKQVTRFAGEYDVTTCGYGEAPPGVVEHLQIPDSARYDDLSGRLITLRMYRAVYWRTSAVRWVRAHVPPARYDIVIANDLEAVPVGLSLKPRLTLHADLHEYTPLLHADHELWRRRITPYFEFLARTYLPRADTASTVSGGLRDAYRENFGVEADLVVNAAPYADLSPSPVGEPIRLVHSGACLRNRELHSLVAAASMHPASVTLDLFLTANDPEYLAALRDQADSTTNVRVREPVPYDELVTTLNDYDVGIHVLPPVNFNNRWALPNKFFDYVQARLGVVIGPSPEMERYVLERGLGVITEDFGSRSLGDALARLTPEAVRADKTAADASANELSAEAQVEIWAKRIPSTQGGDA
tara:strand:- start:4675 stop:5799 length:1125 start_codon:yes stop_codon:yes gene_type:complete